MAPIIPPSSDDILHEPPAAPTPSSAHEPDDQSITDPQSGSSPTQPLTPSSHILAGLYTSSSSPSSSSSSSSSSGSNMNSLFPGLPPNASALASKHNPSLTYFAQQSEADSQDPSSSSSSTSHLPSVPVMPEKCFSFCTQSNDGKPMCRMLCWRKRPIIATRTQEQELKRLRPSFTRQSDTTSTSSPASIPIGISSSPSSSSSSSSGTWYSRPFDSLRAAVLPYSILYVRGHPDGIVGRYQEELEYDDGEHDFGPVSRGVVASAATATKGRKRGEEEQRGMEWMEWGDHGSLLHLPLTTIFYPLLSIPRTLNTIFSPTLSFLRLYSQSFPDGQLRSFNRINDEIARGGAWEMVGKLQTHWSKRMKETRERREEMMKRRAEEVEKVVREQQEKEGE